jgi:hypothetical protein
VPSSRVDKATTKAFAPSWAHVPAGSTPLFIAEDIAAVLRSQIHAPLLMRLLHPATDSPSEVPPPIDAASGVLNRVAALPEELWEGVFQYL